MCAGWSGCHQINGRRGSPLVIQGKMAEYAVMGMIVSAGCPWDSVIRCVEESRFVNSTRGLDLYLGVEVGKIVVERTNRQA